MDMQARTAVEDDVAHEFAGERTRELASQIKPHDNQEVVDIFLKGPVLVTKLKLPYVVLYYGTLCRFFCVTL